MKKNLIKGFDKTHLVFIVVLLALSIVGINRYRNYIFDRNFFIAVNVPCDVDIESCFDGSSDSSFDDHPYKKILIKANQAPTCLQEHSCEFFSCVGLNNCEEVQCSERDIVEEEFCYAGRDNQLYFDNTNE